MEAFCKRALDWVATDLRTLPLSFISSPAAFALLPVAVR
jgi:hypothetical protein